MKRWICLVTLIASSLVFGQDDPFAAFAEMEEDIARAAEKKVVGTTGKLVENFTGSASMQYTGFFNSRDPKIGGDNKSHFWNAFADMETWTGGQKWRVDVSAWAQVGNQRNTFFGEWPGMGPVWRDTEPFRHRYLMLNELYATYNFTFWDVVVGRKIFKNSLSTLYSPSDKLRPVAGFDPLNTRDMGVWQLRGDYYTDEYTWTMAALPVYQPDKMPPISSRWVNQNNNVALPSSSYPGISFRNIGWFGRVKTVKRGFDLFASLYTGPSRQYVLHQLTPRTAERLVPRVVMPAAGYSTTEGRWEIHGEIAYTDSLQSQDQDFIGVVQGTTVTMDGDRISRLGFQQIIGTVEFAYEYVTRQQYAEGFIANSDAIRAGQSDLMGRLQFKLTDDIDLEYLGHIIFKKWGYANRFGVIWGLNENMTWRSGVEFFGGTPSGFSSLSSLAVNYGNWRLNNRFITNLEYKF